MSLFSKTKSYLGVDLGTASLKMVELENRAGTPTLVTYGFAELPVDEVKFDVHETVSRSAKTLAKICEQSKTHSRKVVAALPTFAVFSSVITLPLMSEKEVGQALTYEAKKIIPLPLEEMVLDWKILKDKANTNAGNKKEKVMRVLLTAAPRNLVKKYQDIFQAAGLELLSLETEAFALERSMLGADPAVALLLDVGALTTDLVIVEDHVPILNRSIDVGGVTVTKSIAQSLNINEHRAEQFKRDVGMVAATASSGGVAKVIENTFAPIINEIKYALSLYRVESTAPLEKIILTGGSAFLPNLGDYLSSLFQVKVVVGDPWATIAYPMELKGVLQEIGPRFGVAIGLALREIKSN